MWLELCIVACIAFAASAVLTGFVRTRAKARGLLDIPNERSSHAIPTPRGGGIAIVVALGGALCALALLGQVDSRLLLALSGALAVAWVGFVDDRRGLSPAVRLLVHFGAAIWALMWLGGLPPLQIGDRVVEFGWMGYVLGALGIVWTLNLFNFMDGIDGIAASEAVFIAWASVLLAFAAETSPAAAAVALAFGAACLGFLVWNWPPARIFMGDVGSGFIGYCIAVMALAWARENPVGLLVWLILGAVFFVDATLTLARRSFRGEPIYAAHRSHGYQWLARRWGSHRRVTLCVTALNVVWLFPCAYAAMLYPARAYWIAVLSVVPLVAIAFAVGCGRPENPDTSG